MKTEADIDLATYLAQAPDPERDTQRMGWHLARYRFALEQRPAPARAADLGCGLGFGAAVLSPAAREVRAFDINPQVVEHAAERCTLANVRFAVHDALTGQVPESPYDLICAFEIIEHLEEPATALRHLRASLAGGGRLVLSTPNSADGDTGSHPFHSFQFSQPTLEKLLREHFLSVTIYSQGVPHKRREFETRKDRSSLLKWLRRFDLLRLRRFLPLAVVEPVLDQVTKVSQDSQRDERAWITPGANELARWTVAVCSNENARS